MPKTKGDDDFGYRRRSVEDARKRASEKSGSFDSFLKSDFKKYKCHDGKNLIRILQPTWDDPKHYAYTIFVNYGIGVDKQSYLSLDKMKGEPDPLAEALKEANRDGDKATAKALQPRKRSLMWIIDRMNEDEGPQLWDCPFTVDTDFMNLALDEDTKEVIYVDDPKTGCDIRFYKEGTGVGTKYPAARMKIMGESPLHEDKDTALEWISYIKDNPLPDCLNFYSYEHINGVFDGTVAVRDVEDEDKPKRKPEDDDERPARKRPRDEEGDDKPARKRPPADEDEEQDEKPARRTSRDEEDEPAPRRQRSRLADEDEEADEKPSRKKAADDDEADGGKDEDDAEEKPRQSVRDRLKARSKRPDPDED